MDTLYFIIIAVFMLLLFFAPELFAIIFEYVIKRWLNNRLAKKAARMRFEKDYEDISVTNISVQVLKNQKRRVTVGSLQKSVEYTIEIQRPRFLFGTITLTINEVCSKEAE